MGFESPEKTSYDVIIIIVKNGILPWAAIVLP